MAIPQSFTDLLIQQRRKTKLTGVPQAPYDYAVAGAAGASGRLASARTQKLAEAEVGTQAEQFGQTQAQSAKQFSESLSQQKLHFGKSLAEQKRAAVASEREAGLSTAAQLEAAKKAETMGYVGMGLQVPLAAYAAAKLFGGGAAATAPGAVSAGQGFITGELAAGTPAIAGEVGAVAPAATASQIASTAALTAAEVAAIELGHQYITKPLAVKAAGELPGGEAEWKAGEKVATRTAQGALIGSVVPGVGTAVGAGVGAGVGVVESVVKAVGGGK